jgi:hypothetical protein
MSNAQLLGADLSSANLFEANLDGADLTWTALKEASLQGASLRLTNFEPRSLPELRNIAAAENLAYMTYHENPDALFQLRKQFQDGGFREQERQVTYAIKRRENELAWDSCGGTGRSFEATPAPDMCISAAFNTAFFDWTSRYGMEPGRPLVLIVLLWMLCSLLYFLFLYHSKESGLIRIIAATDGALAANAAVNRIGPPQRWGFRPPPLFTWTKAKEEFHLLRTSAFFSLMSAFNIGFRDLNFGRWLRLLTRTEFDIKPFGWARVVSGWQSLASVYLFALWVLTYFGRPFAQ